MEIKIWLIELVDDYNVELEAILDESYIEAPVGYDSEESSRHYPGHEEVFLEGEPTLILMGNEVDELPDELYDALGDYLRHNASDIGAKIKESIKRERAEAKHGI